MTPRYIPATHPAQDYYRTVYLKSLRWRILRRLCKRRDGYQCRTCENADGSPLHAHHRSYTHRGDPGPLGMRRELRDLITLCQQCHRRIHG